MVNCVKIKNIEESQLVSDIFNDVIKLSSDLVDTETVVERKNIEGEKGGIITGLLLGLATNAVYDLLKTALLRSKNKPNYDPELKIHIDEIEFTLDYIQTHNSIEVSFKKK